MKLAAPFARLPLQFDAARLAAEVAALPPAAWARHPTGFAGNTAARLISVGGEENDAVAGAMGTTPHLRACPYVQQVLGAFGVVWSRSRLMKLAPGAVVPEHADVNYHWFTRVRIHVPVLTHPGVLFYCDDQVVHMRAGEAWIFDNWRLHRVENNSPQERVHLVADTTGSAAFWQLVEAGALKRPDRRVPYEPARGVSLMLERHNVFRVMPPAEMEHLLGDLAQELTDRASPDDAATPAVHRFRSLAAAFCYDWRQLYALYGESAEGLPAYEGALNALREQGAAIGEGLRMRTNRLGAMKVLRARIQYALGEAGKNALAAAQANDDYDARPAAAVTPAPARATPRFERPVFIVSAPRSGSTLLFETLACTPQLWTVGGEAHWLVEGFPQLCPGAPGVDSNRITREHATAPVRQQVVERITERLQRAGQADGAPPDVLRFLEKTPKNALRIPFFDAVFPDALFVFLWRDPRANISSIIEAWKAGGWVTYKALAGWDGPWSMLLPPGWQALRGKPLEEVAAYQWRVTNDLIEEDLAQLAPQRSLRVNYEEFLGDPAGQARRIAAFAGIEFDAALAQRTANPLPLSRHTHTRPQADKWRKNGAAIERILPAIEPTWQRLRDAQKR